MAKVSQTGTFKCKAADWGVSITEQSGIPQFVFQANLHAIFDFESGEWADYSDFDESTMAFLCMFSKAGDPIRNIEQIMKVFGWDGADFNALASGDYSDLEFQVRIEDNDPDYADKNPFQVAWVDVADAVPGGSVRKATDAELTDLNKKYAVKLKKLSGGKKPKPGAKASKPNSPKDKAVAVQESTEEQTAGAEEAPQATGQQLSAEEKMKRNRAEKERTAKEKAKTKGKGMPTRPKKAEKSQEDETPKGMTQEAAWDVICKTQEELGKEKCDDDKVNDALFDAMTEVGGEGAAQEDFTDEQWAQVADVTKKKLVGA